MNLEMATPNQVECGHPEASLLDVYVPEMLQDGRQCRECGFILLSIGAHGRVILERESRYVSYFRCESCHLTFSTIREAEKSGCNDLVPHYEWR